MNLLNLIEDTTTGYDNLRALMQASQSGQDAVLNVGGETVTLDPMETRWIFSKYKAFNKAGRQEEFLNHLADPVKFDQHMKQLRQLIDKQKNFQGSIPGQRGVTGDTMPGQMEEDQAVEEIAMTNPDRPTAQTSGKINWERMIKDYMENKPYSEFEFAGDRPLTLYRSQVYAILKDFGRMKPQQKVNMILTIFGDKLAMVDYIDKLRAKGLMPKKVPAYVAPGVEPVPPGQMDLPGMATPKIKESEAQKKNSEITELDRKTVVNPRVARAFQLARARQSAAGSDIEAFVQDELEKSQAAQTEIDQLRKDNDSQDQQMQQLAAVVQQQDQEIQQLKQQPKSVATKPASEVPAKPAVKPEEPKAAEPKEPKAAEKPAEPDVATQPQQQPTDVAQPAPEKKKKPAVRRKAAPKKAKEPAPDTTVIQSPPYVEIPSDDGKVIPIARARKKKADTAVDPMAAALQGVDMGELGTGTYGLREGNQELNVGDPVIIGGNVEHAGKTGDVSGFGRDKHFVIVDLYNFGKHAFHASNVKYNDYADEEDYVEEGRFKDLDIEQQWKAGQQASQNFKRREQSAGEEEPVGDFRVVRRKDGIVSDLKQHHSSNKAFAHAQALKKKYPSIEIGVRWPTGTINWTGIARENQRMDKFNIAQPTPGGSNKQREEFLNARDRLFRQMANASPGEKEAIRLKIAELEGRAQSQGIKIRETEDLNRSGYNAIKTVGDWAEKMRVMRELQKDIALMSDPEAKAAVQQRIGDLLKVGIKQGYIKEALNDKAMSVLRSLQQPAQPAPAAIDLNTPAGPRRGRPTNAQRAQRHEEFLSLRRHIALLDELIQMKEQIDKLFLKAQNVRGGIYPGLQADIEMEELYPVPETDRQFQDLKDKYTKDLAALQKFLAMKKAVYREDEDSMLGESTALIRLKQARQALSQQGLNEFAPGQGGGGSGNYFQALASAWYNGAFDTGSLQKGIKSKEDVERLLNRGIIGPDGVTRKYAIDYNSDFDGVVISSDDYYEHSDYNDQGQEVDSRNGQPWGPNDYMEFSDDDLSESVAEATNRHFGPKGAGTELARQIRGSVNKTPQPYNKDWTKDLSTDQLNALAGPRYPKRPKIQVKKNKGVAEGHADQVKKVFKDKAGKPVGEIGIDPESSPGNGEWYVHHYATGYSVVGFDSAAEAKRELLYVHKHPEAVDGHPSTTEQGVAEGNPNADPYYVYDYKNLNKRPLKFKTREGAKAYAEKHGLEYCSAGFYHDKVKTKQAEPVRKIKEPQGYDDRIERPSYGMNEVQTDYSKRRQRERDVDAGRPVSRQPKNPQTDYARMRAKQKRDQELGEKKDSSPGKITKSEDPCWTGYHMVGKKKKNGREVPNCVPGKKG